MRLRLTLPDPCPTTRDKAVEAYDRVIRTVGGPLAAVPRPSPQS